METIKNAIMQIAKESISKECSKEVGQTLIPLEKEELKSLIDGLIKAHNAMDKWNDLIFIKANVNETQMSFVVSSSRQSSLAEALDNTVVDLKIMQNEEGYDGISGFSLKELVKANMVNTKRSKEEDKEEPSSLLEAFEGFIKDNPTVIPSDIVEQFKDLLKDKEEDEDVEEILNMFKKDKPKNMSNEEKTSFEDLCINLHKGLADIESKDVEDNENPFIYIGMGIIKMAIITIKKDPRVMGNKTNEEIVENFAKRYNAICDKKK